MITRRRLLAGVSVAALFVAPASARLLHGGNGGATPPPVTGWQTLKIGAGGQLTGIDIASDGTMVVRADTYGVVYVGFNGSGFAVYRP